MIIVAHDTPGMRRRQLLAMATGVTVFAGCLADDIIDPTVDVLEHDEYGPILTDSGGISLYLFDEDEQGGEESACLEACADDWPPLRFEGDPVAEDVVSADLGKIDRPDGPEQVTANGWPLYYWLDDRRPGDVDGQGRDGTWWLLDPAGEPIRE